jgi:hypothetical protein
MPAPTISMLMEEADRMNGEDQQHHKAKDGWIAAGPPPDADAESSIPPAWSVSCAVWCLADMIDCGSNPGRHAAPST